MIFFFKKRSDALEYAGRTHAGTHTHGHHAVLEIAPAQGVDHRGGTNCAGRTQRVAEGNGAAVGVDLLCIKA